MEPEALVERAARVRRRFKMGRLDVMGRGFWEHWRPGDSSFLVGMYSAVISLFLEPSLWFDNWPDPSTQVWVPGPVALSLLLILPFNAWLLDRFLSSKTPGDDTLPRWLHGLRLLALSPPLFSFHTISLWKKFLERRAPAERPSHTACLDLSRNRWRLASGLRLRALYRSGFLFAWMAVSLLPIAVWAVWLAGATWLGAWHRPLVLGACVFLHLVSCVSMALHFQLEIQKSSIIGWRRAFLLIAPFLWLFAIPGMVMGFAISLLAKPSDNSLSWKIHASRTGVNRDPLWQGHQGRLQQQWRGVPWFKQWRRPTGLSHSEGQSRRDLESGAFYRLKTLLLVLESAGLTVLLFRVPGLKTALSAAIRPILWGAVVLAGMGLTLQALGLLAGLCRVSLPGAEWGRHSYSRCLLLTQTAFLAGTYSGSIVAQVPMEQLGLLLCYSAALCAMMAVLFFLFPSPKGPDLALWGLFYLTLAALGGLLGLAGESGRPGLLSFLVISAALSPLWSLGLFLIFGGWLLRPFSWRHAFDRRFPPGFRISLALVTLTAALPLGGFAIPFWIYARHRLWPRYEPFLSDSSERR